MFKDGRWSNFILKHKVPEWFPHLKLVAGDDKYITYLDIQSRPYVLRMFTKQGMKFMPSRQLGTRREFDPFQTHAFIQNVTLIVCDVSDGPDKVETILLNGPKMLQIYPNASIPYADRFALFEFHTQTAAA